MSLINLFVASRNAIVRWRHQRRAYDELMALDDRSLSDIGIHRSQIAGLIDGFDSRPAGGRNAAVAASGVPAFPIHAAQAGLAGGHRWLPPV